MLRPYNNLLKSDSSFDSYWTGVARDSKGDSTIRDRQLVTDTQKEMSLTETDNWLLKLRRRFH